MARLMVFVFVLLVLGAAAFLGSTIASDSAPGLGSLARLIADPTSPVDSADHSRQLFRVESGASAAQIGEQLQQRGLIRSALAFRILVDQEGVGGSLTAGEYELSPSMTPREIIQVLARGQVKRGLIVTIPEGWRAEQVADRLESAGITSREEFLRAVAEPRAVPGVDLLPEVPPSLEGYLFPHTYEVRERVSGVQAAEMMVRRFVEYAAPHLARGEDVRLTPHQVLTLASIVEREAQVASERPTIASVYLNRLGLEMPLQADPTVQYAVANRDLRSAAAFGYWKTDLTTADLQADSAFNSYTRRGLPPTPICNPGVASIQAVVQPEKTSYLYFVARGDGSHLFARTLEEHNANVARVSSSR